MARPAPYDGVLVIGFGGPEGPQDVRPFLASVAAGRRIPPARLDAVAEHYLARGGISPINGETRSLAAALSRRLAEVGHQIPVAVGNRHLRPSLADGLRDLATAGCRRIVAVLTSAYPSYSGCRQYRENLADALAAVALPDLQVERLEHYATHPAYVEVMTRDALIAVDELTRDGVPPALAFVTHSIPLEQEATSGPPEERGAYTARHLDVMRQIAEQVRLARGESPRADLVYCSRSGRPDQPWLVPDINDHLRALAADGVRAVVVLPIGFTSDHMEVVNDLDAEAAQTAASLGLAFRRTPTVRDDPRFVAGVVDLIEDRRVSRCPADCCPNPSGPRPAACGSDDVTAPAKETPQA